MAWKSRPRRHGGAWRTAGLSPLHPAPPDPPRSPRARCSPAAWTRQSEGWAAACIAGLNLCVAGKGPDVPGPGLQPVLVPIALVTAVELCWFGGTAGAGCVSAKQALLWGVTRACQLHVQTGMGSDLGAPVHSLESSSWIFLHGCL